MKSLLFKSTTPPLAVKALIIGFILLMGMIVSIVAVRVSATDGSSEQEGRLITIHDRGEQTVILSLGATIADALKDAKMTIDPSDAVEPALTEALVASEYDVNIYRARPVIVVDGTTRQKIITPYQTGAQIAISAGITLNDADTTSLTRTNNVVSEGAGLVLTIDRSTAFTLTLYGKTTPAWTQGATVADMLTDKNITLGENDRVSPAVSTALTPGMTVRVWREGKQTVTLDEPVAFTIDIVQDGDQFVGYRTTKFPGAQGSRSVTYEIVVQDGIEVQRREIASITLTQPVIQIDIVGAKYRGAYTSPTENEVISWNFFIANGFTREQTAGIMGNLMQEHRFNTTGDGLAQWTGGRKQAMLARPDPYNIYTQLDFLMWELNNGYRNARDQIKATNSVETSVRIFQNKFEKCGVCMESKRIQYAYNILASH